MRNSELIRELTTHTVSVNGKQRELAHTFARDFGWRPSDYSPVHSSEIANAHLLVEHGLKNTAVLTFLHSPDYFSELYESQIKVLLNFSYNNLIDWHLIITSNEAVTLYNRVKDSQTRIVHRVDLRKGEKAFDELRSDKFEQIIGKKPNPNLPALDDVLIKNISHWKRILSFEINGATTRELSSLFNAIIFSRAVEDSTRSSKLRENNADNFSSTYLLERWDATNGESGLADFLYESISELLNEEIPTYLIQRDELRIFDTLDHSTVRSLLSSFYYQESIPYSYDFSVMSKHALSRIYEQYVSVLKTIEPLETSQGSLFQMNLPRLETNKTFGAYYTPQYIARFFARFFQKNVSPKKFYTAKIADPACGSGIFLRTFLEQRFDQKVLNSANEINSEFVEQSFLDIFGIDRDSNATHATSLSLALLQLALKDSFPAQLTELTSFPNILNLLEHETIEYVQNNENNIQNSQDVVVANPPFIRYEEQSEALRERISSYMEGFATGRVGSELAFLRLGLEMLKPGGIGLFVLPHNFLFSETAIGMRQEIYDKTWVLCLADLSAIDVFKDAAVYTILLIFQKKYAEIDAPKATIVKTRNFVEQALQNALDDNEVEKNAYSVYQTSQEIFQSKQWTIVSKTELNIEKKYKELPKLEDFLEIRQGFVTGADPIFIRSSNLIPKKERRMYVPYLPDREMMAYVVPGQTDKVVFYPFIDGRLITEQELEKDFPETWNYLNSHKPELENRLSITKVNWWKPVSPRPPERLIRPKIVTPNLTIAPRFSIDIEGKYAVSRSPIFYPKDAAQDTLNNVGDSEKIGNEGDLLRYFVAVLNSSVCYWYISNHSTRFGKGYSKLEPKTLKDTPVPSPISSPLKVREIIELVDKRLVSEGKKAIDIEQELDSLVSELYDLSKDERRILRMEK